MDRLAVEVRPLAEDEVEVLEKRLPRYTTERHRDRFEEQQRGETTYLVAWLGDQPAGYARLKWQPTLLMGLIMKNTPTVGDLTVKEDLRGRGVGTQIMQAAEDLARSMGYSRLALGVEVDNARAVDFYHRLGFFDAGIPPDRTSRYLLGEGELWHEGDRCICLSKDLVPGDVVQALGRAKVNLYLGVGARRRDGFHSVKTVMQSITLADELRVGPGRGVAIAWAAGLDGDRPERPDLVERTLRFAQRRSPRIKGLGALVTKRIPLRSGLGGGSADAAAALRVVESLDPVSLPPDLIARQAKRLGADIPFCLHGGTALGTGKGDRLTFLDSRARLWWVVGMPEFTLSTEEVYRRFDALNAGYDGPVRAAKLPGLKRALSAGDVAAIAARLYNGLEPAAFEIKPELQHLKDTMLDAGASGAVMTGSGSAIIGLCESEAEAVTVAQKVRTVFSRVEVAASARAGAEVVPVGPFAPKATLRPSERVM